ncbi:MAG: trypsin-like peptidase domain-containing protein [Chloroflexota bacterium]
MTRSYRYFWFTFAVGLIFILSACGGVGLSSIASQPVDTAVEILPTVAEELIEPETAVAEPEENSVVESTPVEVVPEEVAPVIETEIAPIQPAPVVQVPVGFEAIAAQQQAFIDLYARLNPSVVVILTDGGQGSGWVYDNNGHIITNNHVIEGAQQIAVGLADGTVLDAELVGRDPGSDLAVVRVNPNEANLQPIPLGDSGAVQVGQIVIALGSPFGLQNTMTSGIISAVDRTFPGNSQFQIPDIIQTDAAVNPGNSGGPLLDIYGNVIGVNTAIESPVRGSSGIGLAVPSNIVAAIAPQLIQNGSASTPWVGISGSALTPEGIAQLGLNIEGGIVVADVVAGGPAQRAGLVGSPNGNGDIIIGIDGTPVTTVEDLLGYLVQQTQVGQTINLNVIRNGEQITIPLLLEARPTG